MERGNLDYAVTMFRTCIDRDPKFFSARKFLRAAEIKQFKSHSQSGMMRMMGQAASMPGVLKAMVQLKSNKPIDALATCEDALRKDPLNRQLIMLFDQAAEAADLPEIAIQTLAMVMEYFPGDAEMMERLGNLYMKTMQHTLGRQCYETLCEMRPNDPRTLKLLKDAMATDTMSKEWAGAVATGDFREAIKDRKEAEILEKEAKSVRDTADIDALIEENMLRVKREPKNINYRRALASLYLNNKRYDDAIKTLEETQQIVSGRDPQIDNLLSQVQIQKHNSEIAELRRIGDDVEASKLEAVRDAFAFEDLQGRVTRYPNDLQLRYEFGVLLKERDRINDAIQQFQFAQRSPQYRALSLYYIGICFAAKKQYDMAADQLEKALAEMTVMDDQKKATFYELGLVADARGDHAKALEYFKEIYQVDIGYRDVATHIEKGYDPPSATNA